MELFYFCLFSVEFNVGETTFNGVVEEPKKLAQAMKQLLGHQLPIEDTKAIESKW